MNNSILKTVALLLTLCAVLGMSGCDNSELMPWHTEILENEYTADNKNVDSIEGYLLLEDSLFAELEERVYGLSGTGSSQMLDRYTTGSLADPNRRQPNWNRSFELPSKSPRGGVLLLHGMSDSPYSLRAIGQTLQRNGYSVLGLRMPGHGTLPSGLLNLQWTDMAAVVRLGMLYLAQQVQGKPLYIIGYSTGAALALDYALVAEQEPELPAPEKLVLISPAIGVSPSAVLAKWSRRLSLVPGLERLAWLDLMPEFDPYKYNSFATTAAEQVYALTQSVAKRIAARDSSNPPLPPILILKSTVDATVSNDAVLDRLLLKLSPNRHNLVVFDINRFESAAMLLKHDPGPFTARLIADDQLPFAVTVVSNSNSDSHAVTAFSKAPFSAGPARLESLGESWPPGVFSLSHVAMPFPPDDPLYGQDRPSDSKQIFLGQQALQGERGVLLIPADFLLRLRHNPFYNYQEKRVLDWLQ